jgi:flagellar motor switch protein FliN
MNAPENLDIKPFIIKIMPQIFTATLSMEIAYSDTVPDVSFDTGLMLGQVEFSGDVNGPMRFLVTSEFARTMMAARLDSQKENIEEDQETNNLISEITNITADHLKTVITEAGFSCEHSSPSVSNPAGPKTDVEDSENFQRFAFTHGEDVAIFELGFIGSGQQQPAEDIAGEIPDKAKVRPENGGEVKAPEDFDLDLVLDIPIELTVELGRTRIQIHELLKLGPGSAVSLSKLEGEPVDILANDTLIARGQVVVQDEKYGIRVTEITSRIDRIKSFS